MGFGMSLSDILRILEMVFCLLALLVPMFRGTMSQPHGIWCEFVWVFGVILALLIFLIEKYMVEKLIELFVLKHSWSDLTCGLNLLTSLMLLSASLIYSALYVCATCIVDICCAVASFLAFAVYVVDTVLIKLKCPQGYLSAERGMLRFSQALVSCLLFAAVYSYFKGVESLYRPAGLIWCILVYVVCFPITLLIIITHLQKCVDVLRCFNLNKLEMMVNCAAVVLYLTATVLWPLFAYKYYKQDKTNTTKAIDYRWHDMNVVTVLTIVNLGLYTADLVFSVILYKRG